MDLIVFVLYDCLIAAVRIREILEHVGFVQESLLANVVSFSQVLAGVANLLLLLREM